MPHIKTSKAIIKSARLNPINPEDKAALDIIKKLEKQGYSFKQIVVDAVLLADGRTPEMFAKTADTQGVLSRMETLLEQFAQEIIHSRPQGGIGIPDEPGEDTHFAKNFAQAFLQRQQQAQGDE